MSLGGYTDGEFEGLVEQLRDEIECAAEHQLQEGPPRIILHCSRGEGHEGEHRIVISWPREEQA